MIRRAGASLALMAFCVTIVRGLSAGNAPDYILSRALWAMALFFFLGLTLGYVSYLIVVEHQKRRAVQLEEALERERQTPATSAAPTGGDQAASPEDDEDVTVVGPPGQPVAG